MNEESFYSIDRLVEFGMSMAVAQQMVASMNSAMNQMNVPGAHMAPGHSNLLYFVVFEGKQAGPFSEAELSRLIGDGKLTKSTLMWKQGMTKWTEAENIPEILKLVALNPPPIH
jgi:GYF domain 2